MMKSLTKLSFAAVAITVGMGGWKLIKPESGVKYELYHLLEDEGESKNLAEPDALLTGWINVNTPKTLIFKK